MPKLTDQSTLTEPTLSDLLHIVDVSDTSGSAEGTSKQITLADIKHLLAPLTDFGSFGNTVADGTGIPNTSGHLDIVMAGNGGDDLLTPPITPQPVTGGDYKGYVKILGFTEIDSSGAVSVVNGELVIGVGGAGSYNTPHAYLEVSSSTNNNNVGFIFGVERAGFINFSQRVTGSRVVSSNDRVNISGGGNVTLEEGDKLALWGCSEKSATIKILDANLGLQRRS
jgi:hypothetical protein